MTSNSFSRTSLMFGEAAMEKLNISRVAVFGIGGVGGYAVEALVRSGVGKVDLIDHDIICETNINRQIYATTKTLGLYKVDAARERCLEINPDVIINVFKAFYLPNTDIEHLFDFKNYDYVIDAVDTVTAKISLIMRCAETGTSIISAMGAGNKINPADFKVADISETKVCPLARVVRTGLKKKFGYAKPLKVVYSEEEPFCSNVVPSEDNENKPRKNAPASNSFTPSVMGFIIAGEVIKDLTGIKNNK